MTQSLINTEVADRISELLPTAVAGQHGSAILLNGESVLDVCRFLNQASGLEFDYLVNLTGVDYLDYFEVIYHLLSMKHNHSLVLKARCYDRGHPSLPSVTCVWMGADLQEREIFDLLGISFEGHPNLKRIFLWEGFQGHPLRRDFL